ncbi:MAG: hypothetical protein Q9191_005302 [Dirinaria sp. TL-2023a]
MNAVDGSDHYSKTSDEPPASLLTIILDTNPHAWTLLAPVLPLSTAVANLLVFINAHLAFNHANKIAVLASHTQKAVFLYPPPPSPSSSSSATNGASAHNGSSDDVEMVDGVPSVDIDANTYRPFRLVQESLINSLKNLIATTSPSTLSATTSIAGALTLALTHIHKTGTLLSSTPSTNSGANNDPSAGRPPSLASRILILSVSGDLAHQYIPIMNTIFACQRLSIPIDIAKIAGDTVFLQQASDATKGTYMKLEHPQAGAI